MTRPASSVPRLVISPSSSALTPRSLASISCSTRVMSLRFVSSRSPDMLGCADDASCACCAISGDAMLMADQSLMWRDAAQLPAFIALCTDTRQRVSMRPQHRLPFMRIRLRHESIMWITAWRGHTCKC